MLTLPTVYSIPAGIPLAKVLAQSLWNEYKDDLLALSDVEIYLPNRRSCRSLAETFLEVSQGQATILPRLTPLGDIEDDDLIETDPFILDEDPFLQPSISVFERQVLLTQLVLARQDLNLSVTEAYSLAADLAGLIDRAHTEGVDLKKIDTLVPGDLAQHWQITADFLKIVTEAWPTILAERNQADPAQRRNILLEKKADSLRRNSPQHRIIAAGSTGSIPATASLLDVISRLPNGCVVLPCFDPAIDEKIWKEIDPQHPYYFQKRLLERFTIEPMHVKQWPAIDSVFLSVEREEKENLLQCALQPKQIFDLSSVSIDPSVLEKLSFIAADHPNHEARIISLLLRDVLNNPEKTAIVVTADRDLAQKIQLEMERWDIQIDDSGGYKLNQSPVGIYLRLIADHLVTTSCATHILSLLRNGFTTLNRTPEILEKETAELEKFFRKDRLPLDGLLGFAKNHDIPLLTELQNIFSSFSSKDRYTLKEWITQHIAIAETLASSDQEQGSDRIWDQDDGEAAALLLNNLLSVTSLSMIELSASDYAAFINVALSQVTLRPTKRLHPRLRILSPIEARLQQADLFVLAGVNEDVWPAKLKMDTWLSRPMRNALGFLDSDVRIGQAALDFTVLFCAPDVVTTWSIQRDDGLSHPSRWLQQIFAVMKKFKVDPNTTASPYYHWAKMWDQPETLSPRKAPAPSPSVNHRPLKLSVTDIEKWQKDPYTIYAKNILQLYPQEDLDRSIDVRDWGNAAHEILERFFLENGISQVDPTQHFHAIAQDILTQYALNPSQKMKWLSRLHHLGDWTIQEATSQPHPILVEKSHSYVFPLSNGKNFTLHGRTDRLDLYQQGLTITDYKTGNVPSRAKLADGSAPQLPLLGLIFQKDYPTIRSLRYIHLSGTEKAPATITEFAEVDTFIQFNKQNLENLLQDYYRDEKPYTAQAFPKNQYDNYKQLKRVAEWAVTSEEDNEEESE